MTKMFRNLPNNPNDHFEVCSGHAWSKIHNTHKAVVVYRYAGCIRCGKSSNTNNTLSQECGGCPASEHARNNVCKLIIRKNLIISLGHHTTGPKKGNTHATGCKSPLARKMIKLNLSNT